MSHYEIKQLRKEAKFFRLDDLEKLCDQNIKFNDPGYGDLNPQIIGSRSEFDEILERARTTGKCTLLVNVDMVKRAKIKRITDIGSESKMLLVLCHGKVTAYGSEFYKAGKLIKCSDNVSDLLSFVYYTHTGILL